MPRNTRAAMRANAILADEAQDANPAPTTATPDKERAPLGDIDANNIAINEEDPTEDNSEPPNKPKPKGKKDKAGKKGKKQPAVEADENVVDSSSEVKEDGFVSDTSDAVTQACEDLMKPNNDGIYTAAYAIHCRDLLMKIESAMGQFHVDNSMSTTPPSPAVEAVRMQLQEAQSTNLSSPPDRPSTPELELSALPKQSVNQDNSPNKSTNSTVPSQAHQEQATASIPSVDGSTAKKTSSRSPPRPVRIEDSVEAIDALEEAIEQIDDALPISRPSSAKRATPTKEHTFTPDGKDLKESNGNIHASLPGTNSTRASLRKGKPVTTPKASSSVASKKVAPKPARNSVQPRPTTKPASARPSIAKTTAPKPISPKESTVNPEEPSEPITNVSLSSTKQRPVSASLRPPPPLRKSTKPPTKSTFELPGEAISRKLKEQREERLKREEEEKQKKREFKARPIRKSIAPVVKPTAASRARASILHGDLAENDHAPKIKAPRVSTINANGISSKRVSVLTVSKRSSVLPATANTSARRSVSNSSNNNTKMASTTTFVPNSAVTSTEIAQQKLKGKEVFRRDRIEKEETERKRKDKEEAAKLARVSAAERGRQASREWAEKQKKAKAAGAAGKKEMEGAQGESIKA
ncbi:MAG: hypothetical protein M1812_007171 [Candelaria pacifica]|nr:MAG: hypothetical protein M1812_007171 [Candelaria pacifica]